HQGAIGAGVDIGTGRTLAAVWYNEVIEDHPDTGNAVRGVVIPNWLRLLALASQCYELTGLGYQGVDFVLDRDRGPLMLELNARPGLNIQIANHAGLYHRLRQVEQNHAKLEGARSRIAFAIRHFGA
ncbi:MAG: alpha-L-glutamate ligase, partial [Thiotrichales bacterium SG8_50]